MFSYAISLIFQIGHSVFFGFFCKQEEYSLIWGEPIFVSDKPEELVSGLDGDLYNSLGVLFIGIH